MSDKCPDCGELLTGSVRQSGVDGWHLRSEIDGPHCVRRQLAAAQAENALLRNQLIGELRSELALSSAYGAIATIAHCENRLAELEAAEAAKETGR